MTQSRWMTNLGWIISGLILVFLIADAIMKLLALAPVLEAGEALGFPSANINRILGLTLLVSTLLAAIPRTALIGSVLVTAYLGGAIATQLRVGAPLGSHVFFGVYLGSAMWLGLLMRSPNIRALFLARS